MIVRLGIDDLRNVRGGARGYRVRCKAKREQVSGVRTAGGRLSRRRQRQPR